MSDDTKFGPPKGMRDWLPRDVRLRQKLIRLIERHYQLYGFQPLDTPVLENIEVLQGKGGGENEKLMFRVLKRGDDLARSWESKNVADLGLRFDLTVPLARYAANHWNDLPKPFRCYHIGPVWRADRPQRGRFREFYQCDIDIVGGAAGAHEVELLLATDRVLRELNVGKFKIRVSDKRLLPALLGGLGVEVEKIAGVAVALDKLDKQPFESVWQEIERLGHAPETLTRLQTFLRETIAGERDLTRLNLPEVTTLHGQITALCERVREVNSSASVAADPLLVRGFDYYTGPVFEIAVEDANFAFSIGGGGRYDGLIEKLGGPKNTPAVGISLGFERILTILQEKDQAASAGTFPRVYLANFGQSEKDLLALAETLRSRGIPVEAGLEKRDFPKQMMAAQAAGIELAVTGFGPAAGTLKVRRLSTRQDQAMTIDELATVFAGTP